MSPHTECHCPDVDPSEWHLKDLNWSGKFFYYDSLTHVFNSPVGYEKRVVELKAAIAEKGYTLVNPDMVLVKPGAFQGTIMMEINDPEQLDANVEPFNNVRILSRVYFGPVGKLKKGIEEVKAFAQDKSGLSPKTVYVWYLTCSHCNSRKGSDITVMLARA